MYFGAEKNNLSELALLSNICLLLFFVAFPWVVTSTGLEGFMVVCVFYDMISGRLNRKWFYGEAGSRTCDPWLQDIGLSPTPRPAASG